MKKCTKCNVEKKSIRFNKNKNSNDRLSHYCKLCRKQWKIDNKNKVKKQEAMWKNNNKNRVKENVKNWVKANPDKVKANTIKWVKANPNKVAANNAKRRAKKRNQTPNLTEEEKQKIHSMYRQSKELFKVTGVQHDIHHIVPLKDGGKHHPDNLEILTQEEHIELHKKR